MIYTAPHYYRKFKCTASACADTCCAGWAILIDERTMCRYQSVKGTFGNRLRNSIDWREGSFHQYEGRCAFLNEENLCDIYTEAGAELLCGTCRNYPRHIEEFEGRKEFTLSLSCPEAAKLILGCREPVRFLMQKTEKDEKYPEFDLPLFTKLSHTREVLLSVLQAREAEPRVRMAAVLGLCHDVQARIDKNCLCEIDGLLERVGKDDFAGYCKGRCKELLDGQHRAACTRKDIMESLFSLEVLQKGWLQYLQEKLDTLYGAGEEACRNYRLAFAEQYLAVKENSISWSIWAEQLMVYAVSTYFCGAAYDKQAFSKGKLAVVFTLVIQELCLAFWVGHGTLAFEDVVEISHRFSRELEHSDLNLKVMEEMLGQKRCYGFLELIGILENV